MYFLQPRRLRRDLGSLRRVLLTRQRGQPVRHRLQVQVTNGLDVDKSHLLADWARLHEFHPSSSPFQSAAWVRAYCRAYGGSDVFLVQALLHGETYGVGAFRRARRGPTTVLTAAPPGVSDFTDVILGSADNAGEHLAQALLGIPGWDVLEFPEVPSWGDLPRLLQYWPGRVLRLPAATCAVQTGRNLDEFLAGLPARKRKQFNQQRRRIERAGVTVRQADEDPARAVRGLLELHRQGWADRSMNQEHGRRRFEDLLVEAVSAMAPQELATVTQFRQRDRILGAALFLVGARDVGVYLTGQHPEMKRLVNMHTLETLAGFEVVVAAGRDRLNLLRGAEPHKLRFASELELNERILLVRPGSVAGEAAAAAVDARRRAALLVRTSRRRLAGWRRPNST